MLEHAKGPGQGYAWSRQRLLLEKILESLMYESRLHTHGADGRL